MRRRTRGSPGFGGSEDMAELSDVRFLTVAEVAEMMKTNHTIYDLLMGKRAAFKWEDPRFEEWLNHFWSDLNSASQCAHALRRDHAAHGPAAVAAGRAMIGEWLAGL